MTGQGLESGELDEIIRTVDELLDRINFLSVRRIYKNAGTLVILRNRRS